MIHVKMASIEYLSLYRGVYIFDIVVSIASPAREEVSIVSRRSRIQSSLVMCLSYPAEWLSRRTRLSYPCHILPRDVFILSLIALLYLSAVCVRVAPSFKNRPSPLRFGNLYLAAIEDAVCDDTVGRKPEHYHA